MIIGILSDSHGKLDRLGQAIAVLKRRGAEAIVHCGDIGRPECLLMLAASGLPVYAVAGNMDAPAEGLADAACGCGVQFGADVVRVALERGQLAVTHGNDSAITARLIHGGQFRYVCVGHTHVPRDERVGPTRVINPGALYRAHAPSVAILDTVKDTVEQIEIE
jgi:uncharacterized protein